MKKLTILILLLNGAVLVFAQAPRAFIREMTGTVELKKAGSEDWIPARLNDPIAESTIISTGFKSSAVVAVGNSTLNVRSLTRMSLETMMNSDNTDKVNVGLNTGRIRADVKPPAGGRTDFSVQANKATASVRGTSFEMDTISLRVSEGSVSYQPAGGNSPVIVKAGQQSRIEAGAALSTAAALEESIALPPLPGPEQNRSRARRVTGTVVVIGTTGNGIIIE